MLLLTTNNIGKGASIDWSLIVAIGALLVSVVLPVLLQIWNNCRQDRKDKEQSEFQNYSQSKLEEFQEFKKSL
ncbi:hypothetical protein [Streptococcus pluranimalium]|uniref:hypothetical protein n=1 Tax=Streptococcus pluranimalium TaxID=82348 RepID=UPI004046D8EE